MDSGFSRFEIFTTTAAFYLCLGFVCVFVEASDIEEQVAAAARAEATEGSLLWVGVQADGQQIILSGAAVDEPAKDAAADRAAQAQGVTSVVNEIEVVGDQQMCQTELNDRLASAQVVFSAGRHELPEESFPLLEDLANVAAQCAPVLEVAVHTTSRGDAEVNLKLSQRRAESVAKYLVRAGVPSQRLIARGYGEAQPLYVQSEDDADQRNQRIEIRVRGQAV